MGKALFLILLGLLVGLGASFTGLGGGFLMVPVLLLSGYSAQRAVGTSFMAIFVISLSALFAHGRLDNVDFKTGLLLGLGGVIGAQIGARLLEGVTTGQFKRVFAVILAVLSAYLFFKS